VVIRIGTNEAHPIQRNTVGLPYLSDSRPINCEVKNVAPPPHS
jgi:hypothetical protein